MHTTNAGINHIEFWVSDLKRSLKFYEPIFAAIGWRKVNEGEFSAGSCVIYFAEKPVPKMDTVGPRHICFQATSRAVVDAVARIVTNGSSSAVIRGPLEMPQYSKDYYTIDFRDPDEYVIEVAHTPNMVL